MSFAWSRCMIFLNWFCDRLEQMTSFAVRLRRVYLRMSSAAAILHRLVSQSQWRSTTRCSTSWGVSSSWTSTWDIRDHQRWGMCNAHDAAISPTCWSHWRRTVDRHWDCSYRSMQDDVSWWHSQVHSSQPHDEGCHLSRLSQNQFRNIMHLDHAKLIWDRLSDVYEGHRTCHDPWFEDFKESLKEMTFAPESSSAAPCLYLGS